MSKKGKPQEAKEFTAPIFTEEEKKAIENKDKARITALI